MNTAIHAGCLVFLSILSLLPTKTMSSEISINTTSCGAGNISVPCLQNCVPMCNPGYQFVFRECGDKKYCPQCREGGWCNGSSTWNMCGDGMTSDIGSRTPLDCRCVHGTLIENGTCDTTCATGYVLTACGSRGESRCQKKQCDIGYYREFNGCEDSCVICRPGYFCNGGGLKSCNVDYTMMSLMSPPGSSEEGNCSCHDGHTRNGSACQVCPEGSFCDKSGQHKCPDGMTSNLASSSQQHCFCLENYTGTLNCDERRNSIHHRCNNGFIDQRLNGCKACDPGYVCDGSEEYRNCPDGTFGPWLAGHVDECNCKTRECKSRECKAGHYDDGGLSRTGCTECASGSYKEAIGHGACSICPDNMISDEGSISKDSCHCEQPPYFIPYFIPATDFCE